MHENPTNDARRRLPAVDELLRHPEVLNWQNNGVPTVIIRDGIRTVLQQLREAVSADDAVDFAEEGILERLHSMIESYVGQRMGPVINATGILLHTNLGRAPLAAQAVERVRQVAGEYGNVEWDRGTGKRGVRGTYVEELLKSLTGAEAALVVNNCAAATWLTLRTIGEGKKVIVSRGQLVEIGGAYRLPDVFESAGVQLTEVGTTNRTHFHDYQRAISEETAALLRVHQSNFSVTGFVKSVPLTELVELAHQNGLRCVDDLGSGCVHDLSRWGVQEPTVKESIAAGADLVLFSGDKLLGGPQAGIIVGRTEIISRLRTNPLCRALRIDKLTTAALEATLELHLEKNVFELIPILRAISTPAEQLKQRCEAIVRQVIQAVAELNVAVVESQAFPGGGSIPEQSLPSWAVALSGSGLTEYAARLRRRQRPIAARVQNNQLLFDMRAVDPADDTELIAAICELGRAAR